MVSNSVIQHQSVFNKSRKDKFLMVITPPKFMKDINMPEIRRSNLVDQNAFEFSLISIPVPQNSVPATKVPYGGQTFSFTSYVRPDYGSVSAEFVVDNEYKNFWYITKWLDMLHDEKSGIFYQDKIPSGDSPHKLYATDISVFGLDEYNKPKIEFKYVGCVPENLGDIKYSYQDPEELGSSFTFAFSQMHRKLL